MVPVNAAAVQRGREIAAVCDLAFARASATAAADGRPVRLQDYRDELAQVRAVLPPLTEVVV